MIAFLHSVQPLHQADVPSDRFPFCPSTAIWGTSSRFLPSLRHLLCNNLVVSSRHLAIQRKVLHHCDIYSNWLDHCIAPVPNIFILLVCILCCSCLCNAQHPLPLYKSSSGYRFVRFVLQLNRDLIIAYDSR